MQVKQVFAHYQPIAASARPFRYCPFCATELVATESGGRERPACPACGFVQYQNPAPAVSILIVGDGRVLLGKRRGEPGAGTWALPSGYLEYDDDLFTAATREAREETGLEIQVDSILNAGSSFVSPHFHFFCICVAARVTGGALAAGDDLSDVAWFPLAGPLPELGFAEDALTIALYAGGFPGLPVDPEHAASRLPE